MDTIIKTTVYMWKSKYVRAVTKSWIDGSITDDEAYKRLKFADEQLAETFFKLVQSSKH